uniref:Putative secreted salivary protein n=1 Tax=Ixodes ricinus TaxID=34613 RepID=V5H3V8_IXORI
MFVSNTSLGVLLEATVSARLCYATCTYRGADSASDTVVVNGVTIWSRKYNRVTLPPGMPCAFGAKCDNNGKCILQVTAVGKLLN